MQELPSEEDLNLAELFASHAERLGRLAYLLVGSAQDAEDVVATVYARIARGPVAELADPVAYLGRAVANEARSHHRRLRREKRILIRLEATAKHATLGASELFDALKVLNPLERTVVVLHYYDDRSIDEIAALLDLPRGTAGSAQSRALAKLRRVLEP